MCLQVVLTWQQNGNIMAMRIVSVKLDVVKEVNTYILQNTESYGLPRK